MTSKFLAKILTPRGYVLFYRPPILNDRKNYTIIDYKHKTALGKAESSGEESESKVDRPAAPKGTKRVRPPDVQVNAQRMKELAALKALDTTYYTDAKRISLAKKIKNWKQSGDIRRESSQEVF
jgi:hypothetical protein